jgi:hypothetical protein
VGRVEEAGEEVGGGSGGAADADGLEGVAEGPGADQFALDRAEEGKGEEGDEDGIPEGEEVVREEHIGEQGDEASGDVGESDGEGGAVGAVGGGLFEAEFEAHHEVDPGLGVLLQGIEDGGGGGAVDGVGLEDLVDLFFFIMGALDDLALLADAFGVVVLDIAPGGEVSAEAHGDGAGGDLGEAGEDDDVGGRGDAGEAGGEGEGDGEAVGEADDDIADGRRGLKVAFDVGTVGNIVHEVSLSQGGGKEAQRWKGWTGLVAAHSSGSDRDE